MPDADGIASFAAGAVFAFIWRRELYRLGELIGHEIGSAIVWALTGDRDEQD